MFAEFADLELGRAKIDNGTMLHARSANVTEDLGDVLVGNGFSGFQLKDEQVFDDDVCVVLTHNGAIEIANDELFLLLDFEA